MPIVESPAVRNLVVFAHGKESGPWGTKITRLAEVARRRGFEVISPDYSRTQNPRERVAMLLALAPRAEASLVLVGSSLGGYVSAMACDGLAPQALFLIAPALYFPGFDEEPPPPPPINAVVHGWRDDIVPVERAIRYAARSRARLHLLDGGHTLVECLPELERIFDDLLCRALLCGAYRLAQYSVAMFSGPISLRVDHVDAEADKRLATECGVRKSWALVTACNPLGEPLSWETNAARIQALRRRLDSEGIRRFEAEAFDPEGRWPAEQGDLLCDLPVGYAELLGREFDQNAILFGTLGAAPKLVWLR